MIREEILNSVYQKDFATFSWFSYRYFCKYKQEQV